MKKNLFRSKTCIYLSVILTGLMFSGCDKGQEQEQFYQIEPAMYQSEDTGVGEIVNMTQGMTADGYESKTPSETDINKISHAGRDLFYEVVRGEEDDANVLLSPTSIDFALAMTENGAAENTLAQMEKYVNGGISLDCFNPVMKSFMERMGNSSYVTWNVANSLWLKNDGDIRMQDEFLNNAVGYYDAEVYLAPFTDQTLRDINSWSSQKTNDMIPEILDYIDPQACLYLINAISFDGEWDVAYEEDKIIEGGQFKGSDGTTSEVTFLSSEENRYFRLGDGEGFIKPYKGGDYSFVGILPPEGVSCEDFIWDIENHNIDIAEAIRNAYDMKVYVKIPEFEQDYDIELSRTYIRMGMTDPFDRINANFNNMLSNAKGEAKDVYIGRVIHKTHIEVDRKGTRAAAETAVEMRVKGTAMVEETEQITLDRPFVYAIVDSETCLPLFIGCQEHIH